jgi:phosphoribosylanthranilate isomerase
VGVVLAGGPRSLDPMRARTVLDGAGRTVERAGVFVTNDPVQVARTVRAARLDIVQLHGDPTADDVRAVRQASGVKVWAVARVNGAISPDDIRSLWEAADALVLDSRVNGKLGGTGTPFDWGSAQQGVRGRSVPLVVAGGLTAANVAQAIETLRPEIVDVSSGVESSPGIKDHTRIADFIDAVRRARSET